MKRHVAAIAGFALGGLTGCSGCATSPPPVVVETHVVTPTQCAVLELRLANGVTKTICLTADQLQRAMEQESK
jgi:hypothetical protein